MYKALAVLLLLCAAIDRSTASDSAEKLEVLYQIFGVSTPKPLESLQPSTIVPPTNRNMGSDVSEEKCTLEDGSMGECVPYYQCDDNDTIITDGAGLLDIRFNDDKCKSYMDRCCTTLHVRPPHDPIKPRPSPGQVERTGCGWRNPKGADMRTTGETDGETKFGEFPWMCALFKLVPVEKPRGEKVNLFIGGASLIHPRVALTVAHYVATENQIKVRAGDWDTQSNKEIYPYQDRHVQTTVIHEDYTSGNLFYDIAVLFLAQPMWMTPNVGVACLAPPRERTPPGTYCFATGWGMDKYGQDGRYQNIMKKVELPVVDRGVCEQQLRRTRLGARFKLHSSFMCAGGEPGRDTCRGDGGSPLSCPIQYETDRYMQSGIVSWGIGCHDGGTPGVYVDVANLRNWIDDKVAGQGYDTKVYTI